MAEISSATVELVEPVNHTLLEFWFQGYSFAENASTRKIQELKNVLVKRCVISIQPLCSHKYTGGEKTDFIEFKYSTMTPSK